MTVLCFLKFLKLLKNVLALQFIPLQTVVISCVCLHVMCWCFLLQRLLTWGEEKKWLAWLSCLLANDSTESKKLDGNDYIIVFIFHNFMEAWIYSWYQFHLSHLFCGWFLAVTFSIPPHHLLGLQLSLWFFCDVSIQEAPFFIIIILL